MTKSNNAIREAAIFSAITLGLSYFVFWGPLAVTQTQAISFVDKSKGPVWAILLYIFGGFVPSIVGLAMYRITDGAAGFKSALKRSIQLKLGAKWYGISLGIIVLGGLSQIALNSMFGHAFNYSIIVVQLPSLIPLIILGPLSEEFGWRGYLLGKLQTRLNPLAASLIVGIVWGLWHLPLFYMNATSQHVLGIPFIGFVLNLISISIIMTWIMNNTGRSLWAAIFFHWIYTFCLQVVSTGVTRSALYNWLEPAPFVIVAVAVLLLSKGFSARAR